MSRVPQPPLSELLDRYLQQQADAHAAGMALPESLGEVVPHDAAPAQPIDPRTAWNEARTALGFFHNAKAASTPPDWPTLVVTHEPEMALAFAAGNFPQLVRNILPLWQTKDLTSLCPRGAEGPALPALTQWAGETLGKELFPESLLALGALRLARQYDAAEELFREQSQSVPTVWRAAWANEQAALSWHRGQAEEALTLWQAQRASVPARFNRGMAALFLGRPADARSELEAAVAQMPEESAWHHLARLYLALAEMK